MAFPELKELVLGLWTRHRLRIVLGIHLLLISWATLGRWSHMSLLVHYLLFLVSLIWALALPQSEEAVLLCLVVNLLSILLDIIALSIHFPRFALFGRPREITEEFSAGMAIINLLARGPSTFALWKEWGARGGGGIWPVAGGEVGEEELGGSVRSASVLSHYRGQFSAAPQEAYPAPAS